MENRPTEWNGFGKDVRSRERRLTTGDTCRKAMLGDVTKMCYIS